MAHPQGPSASRVLGLDPGTHATGFGVVEQVGQSLRLVDAGTIRTPAKAELSRRLLVIFQHLGQVITRNQPQEAAVEGVFTSRNPRSAILLGQARGVALLAAAHHDLPVFEYPPASVKMALVGAGRADKEQVRAMVRALLATKQPLGLDASDALALAITHLHSRRLGSLGQVGG